MRRVQSAYDRLPSFAQTAALNAYGVRNIRRHRAWDRVLASLKPSETWTAFEQKAYVAGRLRAVISAALEGVPRYASFRHLANDLRQCAENCCWSRVVP